ncbi:LytTR family DNA-binding domain-containing protein [Flavonifractor sp. An10]|uniref:LytR/AlgR family response regulator transcription factor n=1 Tax=Flavonifractor sp. An10 TaxID=1965537 RepID=UPI000B370F1A|nr:LytTR family DNA-binding domain-containing protein [Flavonifractor sp. An10]OUQ83162.1 hypothetical protein B5E42_06195 [Flavonifractor sp. An10]
MLRISVCDDEPEQLERMARLAEAYLAARPELTGTVARFDSGRALLAAAEAGDGFELCLLDVIMPPPDGIETGLRLRELGEDGEIIYLTASDGYAVDSYDVRAFFYLLKPVEQKRLFRVLDQAVDKLRKRREEAVVVPTRGGARRVPLERIRYVERVGRVMRYCCTDGVVDSLTLRGSFREKAEPLLADPRFHLCGASFVLNLQHVAGVEGRTALLDDGSRIFLPRAAAAAFKEAWGRFWLEGRGL